MIKVFQAEAGRLHENATWLRPQLQMQRCLWLVRTMLLSYSLTVNHLVEPNTWRLFMSKDETCEGTAVWCFSAGAAAFCRWTRCRRTCARSPDGAELLISIACALGHQHRHPSETVQYLIRWLSLYALFTSEHNCLLFSIPMNLCTTLN